MLRLLIVILLVLKHIECVNGKCYKPRFAITNATLQVSVEESLNVTCIIKAASEGKMNIQSIFWIINGSKFSNDDKKTFGWVEWSNLRSSCRKNQIANCSMKFFISVLQIKRVKFQDFSTTFECRYSACTVNIDDGVHKFYIVQKEYKKVISYNLGIAIFLGLFFILLAAAALIYVQRIEILLFFKDRFGKESEGEYDLFICYNSDDSGKFVADFLLPYLEITLKYKCFVWERNFTAGEYVIYSKILESKRFLLLMSSNVVDDELCIYACQHAVEQAIGRRSLKLISMLPNEDQKKMLGLMLTVEPLKLMRETSTKVMQVEPADIDKRELEKFWKKVRLYMPPLRREPSKMNKDEIFI